MKEVRALVIHQALVKKLTEPQIQVQVQRGRGGVQRGPPHGRPTGREGTRPAAVAEPEVPEPAAAAPVPGFG